AASRTPRWTRSAAGRGAASRTETRTSSTPGLSPYRVRSARSSSWWSHMCWQLSAVKRRQVIGVRPRAHTDDGRRNGVRLTRLDYGTPLLFVAPFFVVFGLFG